MTNTPVSPVILRQDSNVSHASDARSDERPHRSRAETGPRELRVAILIPAHNEELVIEATLKSVVAVLDPRHVYVFCDACTDSTADIARRYLPRDNVLEHAVNIGKSRGLELALAKWVQPGGYEFVSIVDADTTLEPDFLKESLRVLRRTDVACVVGQVKSRWYPDSPVSLYRTFIYVLWQFIAKRVQSWLNAITIASGCSSTWKTEVLDQLEFDHNMSTEDFSLTIQVHRLRLGKIKYVPRAVVWTQDPFGVHAYSRQSYRWMRAWWESVRKYRVGFAWIRFRSGLPTGISVMDVAAAVLLVNIALFFSLMVIVPVLILVPVDVRIAWGGSDLWMFTSSTDYVELLALLYASIIALALLAALVSKRPRVFIASIAFIAFVYVDIWIAVRTLASTIRRQYRSTGAVEGSVWTSVARRRLPVSAPATAPAFPVGAPGQGSFVADVHIHSDQPADAAATTSSESAQLSRTAHPDVQARIQLAKRHDLVESAQRRLACDPAVQVQLSLLQRRTLSEGVSLILAQATEPLVRMAVARRTDCPVGILAMLANDGDPGVCREVAQSSRVAPDVLAMLSEHSDVAVRSAVAQNTRSSRSARSLLGRDVDETVRHRAADAARTVHDVEMLSQLARNPDAGIRLMVALAGDSGSAVPLLHDNDPRVRWSAVDRVVGTCDDLRAVAHDSDPMVRLALARSSSVLSDEVAVRLLADSDARVRVNLARRPDLSPSIRSRLAEDVDLHVRRAAEHPRTHRDTLPHPKSKTTRSSGRARSKRITETAMLEIVRSGDIRSMRRLVQNRACTNTVRLALAESDDVGVRRLLAASRRSEPTVLSLVLNRPDDLIDSTVATNAVRLPVHPRSWLSCSFSVREALARRRDLSDELRTQLAADASSVVRLAVATNPTTGPSILELLASDVDHLVRAAVAGHRNTSASILRGLVDDVTYETRRTLTGRLDQLGANGLSKLATNGDFRLAVARSKHAPSGLLRRLLADDSHVVASAAAENHGTRPSALYTLLPHPSSVCRQHAVKRVTRLAKGRALLLAADPSWTVREALAQNPIAPVEALDVLAREETFAVRIAVARNPNTSAESLDSLRSSGLSRDERDRVCIALAENPRTLPITLQHLAADANQSIREAVARHQSTSDAELILLAADPVAAVRAAVAGNERTPSDILIRLAGDAHDVVRRSSAANPNLPAGVTLEELCDAG